MLKHNYREVVKNNLFPSKRKIIYLLILFGVSSFFSQNITQGTVEYIVKNNENFDVRKVLNTPSLKNMPSKMRTKTISAMMSTGKFVLKFNVNESLYYQKDSIEKMKIDTKKRTPPSFLKEFGGGSKQYYTNFKNKQLIVQEDSKVLENKYLISQTFPEWLILNETKKIGNYVCFKAIRNDFESDLDENKKTIVWFTPEIPLGFGPKLYVGLPGLVLEVNRGQIVFLATKITLNPKSSITIKKPTKGIKITYSDYKQKLIKAYEKSGFKLN